MNFAIVKVAGYYV